MEKRLLGGPAGSASSRLVEQSNIRAGLKRRYFLFGTISTFQAARTAVPSRRFRCLREIHDPAQWCCFACSSFGWCAGWSCFLPCLLLRGVAWPPLAVFLVGLLFPCLLLGGAAWSPSLGAVAFFLFLFSGAAFLSILWVSFPFVSVGWCCLASSFFGSWCFATPHGLGVGLLGCWAVGSGVGVSGGSVVRCCVLGRVLGGWVWRWCLVVEHWVAKRMGAFGVFSVWIGVGVFLKPCFLFWARITMKTTLEK